MMDTQGVINQARESRGLKQEFLAKKIYVSTEYMSKLAKGRKNISPEILQRLSEALNVIFLIVMTPEGISLSWHEVDESVTFFVK